MAINWLSYYVLSVQIEHKQYMSVSSFEFKPSVSDWLVIYGRNTIELSEIWTQHYQTKVNLRTNLSSKMTIASTTVSDTNSIKNIGR